MYFLRRLRPLEVAGDRVRSLRLSQNAPVLSAADLPVGPARAVIVVHRDTRGRMDATVGVRSNRGGEVAYWSFDGDLVSTADIEVASDAALTFAESLGFLFDEAPQAGGAAAEKSFREWLEGEGIGAAAKPDREARAVASDDPRELVLDEPLADEPASAAPEPARAPAAAPAAQAEAPAVPARPAALSKFRGREGPAAASQARGKQRRQPLARVQLVKRRSPEEERKLLIRRLITCF
ncbi:MAG TPA: hypothetical protein VII78_15190 [Myxococcota bacterium]|jgi:hypothetical protein